MEKDYLSAAIKSLRPTSEFSYINEDYSTIKWDVLEGKAPTLEEVELEIDHLKELDAQSKLDKATAKAELLIKLGITADEAALLLS
jgi:hypothetical protein